MSTAVPRARGERGASSVEYGLVAVAVAALIAAVVTAFGGLVQRTFGTSCDLVQEHAATATSCGR